MRSATRLAAVAYGKFAVDLGPPDIEDVEGLVDEIRDAVALGYTATACIHPSQVAHIQAGYQPTDDEIVWAKRLSPDPKITWAGCSPSTGRWSTGRCCGRRRPRSPAPVRDHLGISHLWQGGCAAEGISVPHAHMLRGVR